MAADGSALRVLCAGDAFITPQTLAAAARAHLGPDIEVTEHRSEWPDEPFRTSEGVHEAAGAADEVAARARGVHVILTHLAPITAAVLAAAGPGLRVVGVTRGAPVNVALQAATERAVPVAFLPGRNLGAVAEYVGLVGFGAVGARVAQLLAAFGARVLAYDPYADPAAISAQGAQAVSLHELYAASDIVSVHARLTPDNRRMFGAEAFAAMKPGAYFVNTARGELVDQPALQAALAAGRLGGAALDVFSPEPPEPGDPLLGRADVVLTPHLAGASRQVAEESAQKIARAVAAYLRTGELEHCADPGFRTAARGTSAASPR